MEVNFKADFERSESFLDLNRAVQREARELEVLRQASRRFVSLFIYHLKHFFFVFRSKNDAAFFLFVQVHHLPDLDNKIQIPVTLG